MKLALFVALFFVCVSAQNFLFQCQNCSLRNFQFLRVRYPFSRKDTFICNDQRDVVRGPMFVIDVLLNLESCNTFNQSVDLSGAMKHFQSLQVEVDSDNKAIASASLVVIVISKHLFNSKKCGLQEFLNF